MEFPRVIAEGNLVSVDYTNKMTHSGNFFGNIATNKRINASGQFIREIINGKVISEWQTTNMFGLIKQISTQENEITVGRGGGSLSPYMPQGHQNPLSDPSFAGDGLGRRKRRR